MPKICPLFRARIKRNLDFPKDSVLKMYRIKTNPAKKTKSRGARASPFYLKPGRKKIKLTAGKATTHTGHCITAGVEF